MKSKALPIATAVCSLLGFATLASAHPGHAEGAGFAAGVAHPLLGLDHILAMLAVGVLAARAGGRVLWLLPITFVALMVGGGLLASAGVHVPAVEQGIAASVLVLGVLIALAVELPVAMTAPLVGLFAIFHGYAHVAEMRAGQSPVAYAAGFVLATIVLHAVGIAAGVALRRGAARRANSVLVLRAGGLAIAACGAWLCLHVL